MIQFRPNYEWKKKKEYHINDEFKNPLSKSTDN